MKTYFKDLLYKLKYCNEFTEKLNWDSQRKESHAYMVKTGIENVTFNQTKLVLTYLESGNLGGAFQVLNKIPNPNLFLWTAMIRAYTKQGYYAEALILFNEIHAAEIKASPFILASVIKACAGLKTLQKGKEIHCYTISNGYESNVFLSGALVDMVCASLRSLQQGKEVHSYAIKAGYDLDVAVGTVLVNMICSEWET
ncbi:hypothetical protein SUGI_0944930 [Cryptomeria japonica]|nr:hypothetical protein SUGI_0944930 [Cryptomeria japonica]